MDVPRCGVGERRRRVPELIRGNYLDPSGKTELLKSIPNVLRIKPTAIWVQECDSVQIGSATKFSRIRKRRSGFLPTHSNARLRFRSLAHSRTYVDTSAQIGL
jgi:hypothetical protein